MGEDPGSEIAVSERGEVGVTEWESVLQRPGYEFLMRVMAL